MKGEFHQCHLCQRRGQNLAGWAQDLWKKWVVCSQCLHQGRALAARPELQNAGMGGPIMAFWDQLRPCEYCGIDYTFSAQEQRFWYETRGFTVDSNPIACIECRRKLRRKKRAQSELMNPPENPTWQQLERMGDLALEVGGRKKCLEYLRRAKNRCDLEGEHQRLREKIARVPEIATMARKYWRTYTYVEQLEMHYEHRKGPTRLTYALRQQALAQPPLPDDQVGPVAIIIQHRIHPLPCTGQLEHRACLHHECIYRDDQSQPRVLADPDTGVIIWLPDSGQSGRTGFFIAGDRIYGPAGPLPW